MLLEDVNEQAYRIDSYVTHLRRSGWFDGAAGVVLGLGRLQGHGPSSPTSSATSAPIVADFGFGHGDDPITMPLGVLAELDAGAGKLTLVQPALA